MKKAYLVGVDHRIQYTNDSCGPEWTSDIQAFESYLSNQASELEVDLIAEEFSEELLGLNNASSSTARQAANRAHVQHLFLDPTRLERSQGNISTNDHREVEWLSRLTRKNASKPLIICGDGHLDSFAEKLRSEGYEAKELSRNWGINWMSRR